MTVNQGTMRLLILLAIMLSGCLADQPGMVERGDYAVTGGSGTANSAARQVIQQLAVDRGTSELVFTLTDGSTHSVPFATRAPERWPAGCPGSINSTRMEVLDLADDPLVLGSLMIDHPILVRDCPLEPKQLVLREDGLIGGAGTACLDRNECVIFEPVAAPTSPRP